MDKYQSLEIPMLPLGQGLAGFQMKLTPKKTNYKWTRIGNVLAPFGPSPANLLIGTA
jgi:hypothetical protein